MTAQTAPRDHSLRSSFEVAVRLLEDEYRAKAPPYDYGVEMVLKIFRMMPSVAMSRGHIENIAMAVEQLSHKADLSTALGKLIRAKVLRSRPSCHGRLYEVNL